jgi:hypothetical protein
MEQNSMNFNNPKRKTYMQNYNTDSMKPLPKGEDKMSPILSSDEKVVTSQFSESEKEQIRRRRWLESISDCV